MPSWLDDKRKALLTTDAAEYDYEAGYRYGLAHPTDPLPDWPDGSGEWVAGFADGQYEAQQDMP